MTKIQSWVVASLLFSHQSQCPAQQIYFQPALECLQTPPNLAHSHMHVFSILWYTSTQGWGFNLLKGISPIDSEPKRSCFRGRSVDFHPSIWYGNIQDIEKRHQEKSGATFWDGVLVFGNSLCA